MIELSGRSSTIISEPQQSPSPGTTVPDQEPSEERIRTSSPILTDAHCSLISEGTTEHPKDVSSAVCRKIPGSVSSRDSMHGPGETGKAIETSMVNSADNHLSKRVSTISHNTEQSTSSQRFALKHYQPRFVNKSWKGSLSPINQYRTGGPTRLLFFV